MDPGDAAPTTIRLEPEMPSNHAPVPIGRRLLTVTAGAAFGLVLFLGGYATMAQLDGGGTTTGTTVQATEAAGGSANPTTGESGADASTSLSTFPIPTSGPYVLATLENGSFALAGTVPDADTSNRLLAAAEATYPSVQSELAIDAQTGPADWLANSHHVVEILAMATNGVALVSDGQVQLSLQVPTAADADRIELAISERTGLPVAVEFADLSNLAAPTLTVSGIGGQISLGGRVPNDEIKDEPRRAATEAFGQGNVLEQLVVDETVHTSPWMFDPGSLFGPLSKFPELDVRVEGEVLTGYVRGGYAFDPNSADPQPASPEVISFGVDLMNRDPDLILIVEAHTDSDGPDEVNLALSQQRADAVAALFTNAGIDESRITAVGRGETEPLTEDESDAGKARNRRVELQFSSLAGG